MKTQSILKTALFAAGFTAFTLIGSAQAQVINVQTPQDASVGPDLTNTAYSSTVSPLSYSGMTWNVLTFNYVTSASGLLDSNGGTTSVGYTMSYGVNSFNSQDPSSALLDTGGQIANPTYPGYSDPGPNPYPTATLTISSLTAGATYNLAIVSDIGTSEGGTFTISGYAGGPQTTTPTQLTPWALDNQYVEFVNVTPDGSGDITVSMSNPSADYTVPFNGFQLEEVSAPEPSTYALMGLGALALAFLIRRHRTA